MPDTICHSVQGGLMVAAPLLSQIKKRAWLWSFVAIAAFMGALPDLIGAYGNLIEHDHWGEYRVAHYGSVADVLKYVGLGVSVNPVERVARCSITKIPMVSQALRSALLPSGFVGRTCSGDPNFSQVTTRVFEMSIVEAIV